MRAFRLAHKTTGEHVSPLLSAATFVCALLAGAVVAEATEARQPSGVQIFAILASRDRAEFDPRLAPVRQELRGLPFKGYTLLGFETCRFESGDHCAMDIPGGGYMHLTTTQSSEKAMQMRLLLNQHNRPVLNAAITLNRNAGILVKGTRTEIGTMLLCIKAAPVAPPGATTAQQRQP
jgi:hypothetical protein